MRRTLPGGEVIHLGQERAWGQKGPALARPAGRPPGDGGGGRW